MRTAAIAVAAMMLLVGFVALAPGAAASLTARGPILIDEHADFTAANGVTGGTGTPTDPYVIEGWHITTTGSPAITIRDVTKSFVVRHNLLDAGRFSSAVLVEDVDAPFVISDNEVRYEGAGVSLTRADGVVADNLLLAHRSTATGISVIASAATVRDNAISGGGVAIIADAWSPHITGNVITDADVGIAVSDGDDMLVEGNVVERTDVAIRVQEGTYTVRGNTLTRPGVAVEATKTHDIALTGNTIDGAQGDAVVLTDASVHVEANTITNGYGRGIVLVDATGNVTANVVTRTQGGVTLTGASLVHVAGNVLTDNAYGLSIPYSARMSVPHQANNTVNGVLLDDVYHWQTANVRIEDTTLSANFTAGGYGALTLEGAVVLYDVDTALIANVTILHGAAGVTAVNSFNVQVQNSTLVNVDCAIVFDGTVGFVKNTTIEFDIDPVATCGIDVSGGFVGVYGNALANMDVGVRFDASARGEIAYNVVTGTFVGLELRGSESQHHDTVLVVGNNLSGNVRGAVLVTFRATLQGNVISNNSLYGVELHLQSHPILLENRIEGNVVGVVDAEACVTIAWQTCSRVTAKGNVIANNSFVGLHVNGTAELHGNVVVHNGVGANLRGGANLSGNVFANNSGDGVRVSAWLNSRGDVYVDNSDAGLRLTGLLFILLEAEVSGNFHGIVVAEVIAEVPDLPPVTVTPPSPGPIIIPSPDDPFDRDPLYIHLSILEGNRGDAIRANPWTLVNATYNYWGADRPCVNVGDLVGAFQNCVTAGLVHFTPWWRDRAMTETGPVRGA